MEPARFRFGLFEFDTATRELRREGALVRLQSQPAQVLASLIRQAGQVVSREELRQILWGCETFVDFERGLNFCISQIRAALNDDSAEPVYIRTIPKRGYQFIAPTEQVFPRGPDHPEDVAPARRINLQPVVLGCAALILALLTLTAAYRLLQGKSSLHLPVVAVLRFDNETGNPAMDHFSDALTDTVVEQLTSQSDGRYQVIGNALILRRPREHRDLSSIATSLHAAYVVLGQVQSNGGEIRILAHLIRLPDQTHVWVVRTDRTLGDPLGVQSDVAHRIANEFAARVPESSDRPDLLPSASH
jgi:DNA-binding winged helix-turn-helix (wHTH) protein/TolB-like protein